MADLLLRCRCVLEPCRRRNLRIPDQSAYRALLHAGTEPDSCPRPHSIVWRVRNAGTWADALLPPRIEAGPSLEGGNSEGILLVPQFRPGVHGGSEHVPDRHPASVGFHRTRHMVRAIGRFPAVSNDAASALDAGTG